MMSNVLSRAAIQAAAIRRLDKAIVDAVDRHGAQFFYGPVGELLWNESQAPYWRPDIPRAMKDAPWLYLFSRHAELCPERRAYYSVWSECVRRFLAVRRVEAEA